MDEMQALAAAAVSALGNAHLHEEAQYLHANVLGRSPEVLVEAVEFGPDLSKWGFKPIVELLLHEIVHLAAASELSTEARRAQIRWALEVSGF